MRREVSLRGKYGKSENIWGYAFVLPWILSFLVFMVYPFVLSVKTSYFNINITIPERERLLLFGNYANLIKDPMFYKTIFNTLYYSVFYIAFLLVVSLFFAFLLLEVQRGKAFFRTSYLLPYLISPVVLALIYQALLEQNGPIQQFLLQTHILSQPITLQESRWLPMPLLAIMETWKWFGVNTIIFMAGLSGIDKEIIEAATIDGASWLKQIFKVRLPLLKNQMVFVVTVNIIGAMQMYAETSIALDPMGGTYNQMLTPVMYLYNEAFTKQTMGYACTVGIALSLVIYVCTMLQLKVTNRD